MEARCYNHPAVPATATCADCGAAICPACTRMLHGQPFCLADYTIAGSEAEDVLLPVSVPRYQHEQPTRRMPPLPVVKQIEQPAMLIEQYKLTPNFVYQHAAKPSLPPQDTASMLLQSEEAPMPKAEGKLRKAWEDTMIWAVIGLVCVLIAVFVFAAGVLESGDTGIPTGPIGLATLLSAASAVITYWTIISRLDSSHPKRIMLLGLSTIIIIAVLWTNAIIWIQQQEEHIHRLYRP